MRPHSQGRFTYSDARFVRSTSLIYLGQLAADVAPPLEVLVALEVPLVVVRMRAREPSPLVARHVLRIARPHPSPEGVHLCAMALARGEHTRKARHDTCVHAHTRLSRRQEGDTYPTYDTICVHTAEMSAATLMMSMPTSCVLARRSSTRRRSELRTSPSAWCRHST